jgi:threonine dehydrogenase-like Zn-dependent dehydrogenase
MRLERFRGGIAAPISTPVQIIKEQRKTQIMKAVQFPGNKKVEVVDRPIPVPGVGEVLIKMRASALCRSDMSIYYGKPILASEAAKTGLVVPGHEPAGEITEVGPGATGVKIGDRVAVYLAIGCGHCQWCHSGFRMLCPEFKCLGFDLDGGDADYLVAPAVNCLKLPDELSFEAGAVMTDMIGTQYSAQKRLGISGATTLAVFGIGPMGAAGVLIGKARGARVIAVDVLEDRLTMAKALGADEVINSGNQDATKRLRELTGGVGVDVAIDCSGNGKAQNSALDSARRFGSVAFVGESSSTTINPSDQLIRKQLQVIGAWYFPLSEFQEISEFIVNRKIPVEKMITHRFSIDQAADAFRMFDERKTEKAIFVWD